MKRFFVFLSFSLLMSCSKDKFNNDNPYLQNRSFSININTDLPLYNDLKYAGNGVKISDSSIGAAGVIIVFYTGSSYLAYDGACPNQELSSCSFLTLSGINALCPCDDAQYNLYNGQAPGKEYPLKSYKVEINGSVIRVFN